MADFKIGDVVRLKSGGSPKTVELVKGDMVSCVWDDEKKRPARSDYPSDTLIKLENSRSHEAGTPLHAAVKAAGDEMFKDIINNDY